MDLDAQIPHLRVLGRRTAGFAAGWLIVAAAAVAGLVLMSQAAQHLLATGTRVTGVVLREYVYGKSSRAIDVRYPVLGEARTARVVLSDDRTLEPGRQVVVIYDPADPGRVRTPEDSNESTGLQGLCIVAIIVASLLGLIAAMLSVGWFRRYRAVRRTGWQAVTVTRSLVAQRSTELTVYVPGREDLNVVAPKTIHRVPWSVRSRPKPAWLGGDGGMLVLLFRVDDRLRAVQARPRGGRHQRD
ncbi:DUF3592 domain-containing protein [Amycolatopsis sp. GM8]|uniref:DUF3592 domain-containing protein n=1 Tax=Amycolatopsis sp. GM8 TaxID=2896530 RepID=UPI001F30EC25|nr:DUF3592 domain-containing protein [Amycolatopsis sp. GM8]